MHRGRAPEEAETERVAAAVTGAAEIDDPKEADDTAAGALATEEAVVAR